MSLHVRLFTNFWTHRKTARLRSIIGNDALWIPPRLWCYAAENQPDGDFKSYSADELAMLIGYQGDAQAMLEALHKACFLVEMKLHDWAEHNGYHHTFSERAKTAARARWDKEKGNEKIGKERKGDKQCIEHATSNASSIKKAIEFKDQGFSEFWELYPKKKGRGDAEKSWSKIKPGLELKAKIMESLKSHLTSNDWSKDGGKYIPHPATWLNGKRWEDEVESRIKLRPQVEVSGVFNEPLLDKPS